MFELIAVLAGFYLSETPPEDLDSAITVISTALIQAEPENLGIFFAEIGLEASPDEVHLWGENDFYDLVMDFSPLAPDSGVPDSLLPLVESLPLELLESSDEITVTVRYGSNFNSRSPAYRFDLHLRGLLQPA